MTECHASTKELLRTGLRFEDRMAMHTAISEQIWREQNLVSQRMTWNFTFQGMLVAIYVFAGSSLDGRAGSAVQLVLGGAGILVCLAVLFSVVAAQNQSTRLKAHWVRAFCAPGTKVDDCDLQTGPFPQPFSPKTYSGWGRWASRGICIILCGLWVVLVLIVAADWRSNLGKAADQATCTLSKAGKESFRISCPRQPPDQSGKASVSAAPAPPPPVMTPQAQTPKAPEPKDPSATASGGEGVSLTRAQGRSPNGGGGP
ncbi:hypothetical protein [Caulobacter mirabilis]|uniref:Uncharacterized protein n=1 Tax=Caulobacter mirabilis TaxID=69666 RepID=A0A2D2AZW9_9CAUL|nr:hypothetical protein [Caulobacter mirabilis]ATQ43558.1 hypothetical protein CSW64_14680 [Caulobacter mirabilis]